MKCQNCGNELGANTAFCGSCGAKVSQNNTAAPLKNAVAMPTIANNTAIKKIILTAVAVILLIIAIFAIRGCVDGFSPVGVWKSDSTPIELKFENGGKLSIGAGGEFVGGLKWRKEGKYEIYLTGELPDIMGGDMEEYGASAYYDKDTKSMSLFMDGEVYEFKKER